MNHGDDLLTRLDQILDEARRLDDPQLLAEIRVRTDAATAATTAAATATATTAGAASPDADHGAVGGKDGVAAGPAVEEWHGMIGGCRALVELRKQAQKFADANVPVLIRGESGTGKDVVAKILHRIGPRAKHPFISENCSAIPQNLLESVLFGHKSGSFTGAIRDHDGHFVAAHRGTLFLDEIGDMPLSMQAKLLRVLQEGEVRPVGATAVRRVDVRIIAATNQDLEMMVAAGTFRQDLYYRLNVLRLNLPPLRDRGDDILMLARVFLAAAGAKSGRVLQLDTDAQDALRRAKWPGNVRQLQNEIQRLAVLAAGPRITVDDLSGEIS